MHLIRTIVIAALVTSLILFAGAGIYLTEEALHQYRRDSRDSEIAIAQRLGPPQAVELRTPDRLKLRAWLLPASSEHSDTVILLHGQGNNRGGMIGLAGFLLDAGYNILMPDSRGHGESDGVLSTYGWKEAGDVALWTHWAQTNRQSGCVYGLGESMGAAIVLQSLAKHADFCAVVAESPFSTFREIAKDTVGQPLAFGVVPFGMLYAVERYGVDLEAVSPAAAIRESTVPVLLIHGALDRRIGLRHSLAIQAARPQNTELWEVPGARHTGAHATAPAEFEKRVTEFYRAHRR